MQMTNFKQIMLVRLMLMQFIAISFCDYSCSPALQDLHSDSNGLNEAISKTSRLAETISGKVRVLDTAKVNTMQDISPYLHFHLIK